MSSRVAKKQLRSLLEAQDEALSRNAMPKAERRKRRRKDEEVAVKRQRKGVKNALGGWRAPHTWPCCRRCACLPLTTSRGRWCGRAEETRKTMARGDRKRRNVRRLAADSKRDVNKSVLNAVRGPCSRRWGPGAPVFWRCPLRRSPVAVRRHTRRRAGLAQQRAHVVFIAGGGLLLRL